MRSLAVVCMLLESTLIDIYIMLVYEHFCVTCKLISYMHRGDIRSLIFNFAGREKGIVGSVVVEILQPLYFIVYS